MEHSKKSLQLFQSFIVGLIDFYHVSPSNADIKSLQEMVSRYQEFRNEFELSEAEFKEIHDEASFIEFSKLFREVLATLVKKSSLSTLKLMKAHDLQILADKAHAEEAEEALKAIRGEK